jgi:hypothetical protein
VDEAAASKLFRNSDIQRALPRDGIVMVLELLAKRGWRLFSWPHNENNNAERR